jgi:hypothetical protein
METPKQKAQELVDKYLMIVGGYWNGTAKAKQCALIDVQNTIKSLPTSSRAAIINYRNLIIKELELIKTEIEKL